MLLNKNKKGKILYTCISVFILVQDEIFKVTVSLAFN